MIDSHDLYGCPDCAVCVVRKAFLMPLCVLCRAVFCLFCHVCFSSVSSCFVFTVRFVTFFCLWSDTLERDGVGWGGWELRGGGGLTVTISTVVRTAPLVLPSVPHVLCLVYVYLVMFLL